jgi:hypothetical protein
MNYEKDSEHSTTKAGHAEAARCNLVAAGFPASEIKRRQAPGPEGDHTATTLLRRQDNLWV